MKKRKTAPFLGSFKLFWCDTCNLPILDKTPCSICGNNTRQVKVAPPGDIRPAFQDDLVRISKIIDKQYGDGSALALGLTNNRIVLLNEVSYDDLMDEIIIDGEVIGALRYNLVLSMWDFFPRLLGAQRIFENKVGQKQKYLVVDSGAVKYIEDGFNVMAPGVIDIDKNLRKGEVAIALSPEGRVLSVGNMRIDAIELPKMKKGVVLKPKHFIRKSKGKLDRTINTKQQSWEHVVKANFKTIEKYERKALNSIIYTMNRNPDLPLSVSFSGGKDSLVCLNLALKLEKIDFRVLFVNTGLEFSETIDYIESVMKTMNLMDKYCRLDIPTEKFWKSVEQFGPPGKDYRYCCKILKIAPVNDLIDQCVGRKTLSLIGQRAYESIARAESRTLWSNPWIPNQLNFTPIQKWTALHVWLYIFKEKLPYNPLYTEGFSRIGCWLCPASNQGTFEIIKEIKPELWNEWLQFLEKWQKENDLPDEWLSWGLWRWKKIPTKMINLAKEHNVNIDYEKRVQQSTKEGELSFELFEGFVTCKTGDLIVEGTFNKPINLPRLDQFWEIFGICDYDSNLGLLRCVDGDYSITLSADGTITASGREKDRLVNFIKNLVLEVFRSVECTGCRVCIPHCKEKALSINEERNQIEIEIENCNSCKECHYRCPVIKFKHQEINLLNTENENK